MTTSYKEFLSKVQVLKAEGKVQVVQHGNVRAVRHLSNGTNFWFVIKPKTPIATIEFVVHFGRKNNIPGREFVSALVSALAAGPTAAPAFRALIEQYECQFYLDNSNDYSQLLLRLGSH